MGFLKVDCPGVGLLGTGAIANKHAQAYRNLGFQLIACSNRSESRGTDFAARWECTFVPDVEELCLYPDIDFVDVCTYPDAHLEAVQLCARIGRPVLLEKPIATDRIQAWQILEAAGDLILGVVSQRRFDDPIVFLKRAIEAGRLGRILQADAYVKWFRSDEYYARPGKGTWAVEGGGALINQAIHQVDQLLYLAGPLTAVQGMWQLGARHSIESEDIVNALLQYSSGATGVIQAATAFWPGTTERIEIHGTKGLAIVSADKLTCWEVLDDEAANKAIPAPVEQNVTSGSSDPMSIPLIALERQLVEFATAVREERQPSTSGEAGYRALEAVTGIYQACRDGCRVQLLS